VERVRAAVENDYELRASRSWDASPMNCAVGHAWRGAVDHRGLGYLWFRFEWQFAVSAVIATMHDLLLTVGFFALTQLEFNTTSIAAFSPSSAIR